ncbi:thermonuclease family protein [Thermosulfuriphilus sp.]
MLKRFKGTIVILVLLCLATTAGAKVWKRVRAVIDGDTIIVIGETHVRYAGINAPEIAHDDKPGEPLGEEAKRYNAKLVKGKRVRLEYAKERYDRYRRVLAYVFLADGTMVNEALVAAGLAYVCYNPPNDRYISRLLSTQRRAIEARRGIFGLKVKEEPYYIGNSRSFRFHRPWCPFGQKTSRKNKVIFKSRLEAFYYGYCPCRRCRP